MWSPTPEVEELVGLQTARRFEEASRLQRRLRGEMAAQAAATGRLLTGGFTASVQDMVVRTFVEAGTGLIADLMGIASDLNNGREAIDWLERSCCEAFENAQPGLLKAFGTERQGQLESTQRAEEAATAAIAQLQRDARIVFGRARLRSVRGSPMMVTLPSDVRHFFISHAGEDRAGFVGPLVDELMGRGRTVWYSEFELTLGDSLLGKIDEGLHMSRYGVVILSPNFFSRPWPRAELDGLAARAVAENRKIILPVWHQLDHAGVANYSPRLAGLLGIESARGVPAVADAIVAAAKDLVE